MPNNVNIKTLNVSKKEFFNYWLQFLKPYHNLRNKEIELLSLLLFKRHELSKVIKDDNLVDIMLFDRKTREVIRKEMNYENHQVLNNMLSPLRKKKIIIDNKINKVLIPNLDESIDNYELIFNFNIK